MEYSGAIIDSHMHLWDLNNDYQWLKTNNSNVEKLIGNYDKIKKNFLASDYIKLFAKFNVTKAVHLQAIGFLDNPVLETMWLQQQFDTTGMPNAIIAHADLTLPNIEQILLQHCQYSNMRGIRMILNCHEIDYLERAESQKIIFENGYSSQKGSVKTAPIVIGNNVWINFNSYIRKGVRIGDGAIIGACSVVTKDVEPFTLVAGNPAKIVRKLDTK